MRSNVKEKKRKICVFSGKRGGFGAYIPLMELIAKDSELQLQILLGDMHASARFGHTADEVRKFFPSVPISVVRMGTGISDSPEARVVSLARGLAALPRVLKKFSPDILMVHGDRGEQLIAALAALHMGIIIAHTQGGEISGNIDDVERHAITKLTHIHFPETEEAACRIRALGEEPSHIYTVGSLYVDRIVKKMYTDPHEAKKQYGIAEQSRYGIIITHPDTYYTKQENMRMAEEIMSAAETTPFFWIVVYPCSDPGYAGIIAAVEKRKRHAQFRIYKNIPNLDFLGLLQGAEILLGNSSAACVEAPYLHLPAINVGDRQRGRTREKNVIDAKPQRGDIVLKIRYACENKTFRENLRHCDYIFGDGRAAEKILRILKLASLDEHLYLKRLLQ